MSVTMPGSVYTINKGINRPIEFRGLKAQYIGYLGGGLLVLLVLFAILYISGVPPFVCVGITFVLGAALFGYVYKLNHTYGPHGLMKKLAHKRVPKVLKVSSRRLFTRLSERNSKP
jgi:hypothetical protein